MTRSCKPDRVAEELSVIPDLARADLLERWEKAHGNPAPKGINRRLLEYSAAYQVQVDAYGGLKSVARRKLSVVSNHNKDPLWTVETPRKSDVLVVGTRLVREWRGNAYTVDVIDGGFRYDDDTYKSLSRIAHIITGARWSGPRFFGL